MLASYRSSLASSGTGRYEAPKGISVIESCSLKCNHFMMLRCNSFEYKSVSFGVFFLLVYDIEISLTVLFPLISDWQ